MKQVLMTQTQRLLGMIDVDASDLFDDAETHFDKEEGDGFNEDAMIVAIQDKRSRRPKRDLSVEYNPAGKEYATLAPRQIQERNRFRKKQFQLTLDGVKWQLARPTTMQISHERSVPHKEPKVSDRMDRSRDHDRRKLKLSPHSNDRSTIKRFEVIG